MKQYLKFNTRKITKQATKIANQTNYKSSSM